MYMYDDNNIIKLFWERSEEAIVETSKKYSNYCYTIAYNILYNNEDAEECVNDTYLRAWNTIPPDRPNCLATFLGKITRNLSLNKYKYHKAAKRGFGQVESAISELEACIPASTDTELLFDELVLTEAINNFLGNQKKIKRIVFIQRYWYLMPIKEIAEQFNMSESKAKSMLFRTRNELKGYLEKEGVIL